MIATKPWRHQREAADFALHRNGRAMLCVPMGGGKSLSALIVADETQARSVVILCPVSVVGVWRREFARHAVGGFTVICPTGSVSDKAGQSRRLIDLAEARGERVALVVNYESAWRPPLATLLTGRTWDLLILEESHRIKSPFGKASKFATDLARCCRKRLALTGTPAPHSPLDLFAQARAIDPGVFGWSFVAFRNRYAVTHPEFKNKVTKWINQAELQEKFRGLAYECDLAGVLDVPEATDQAIAVTLGAKARKLYGQLEIEMWAQLDKGEISVSNALTRLLRLQQITSGFLIGDKGPVVFGGSKLSALADIIEGLPDQKVVVWAKFREEIRRIAEMVVKMKRPCLELTGESSPEERAALAKALHALDTAPDKAAEAVAVAKSKCGTAATLAVQEGVQMHGGIGVTDEYVGSHYFKRLTAVQYEFGSTDHHLSRYATLTRPGA